MRRIKLFTIDALPYRQPIPVYGYRFGSRKKTLAVMGSIRGDEKNSVKNLAKPSSTSSSSTMRSGGLSNPPTSCNSTTTSWLATNALAARH